MASEWEWGWGWGWRWGWGWGWRWKSECEGERVRVREWGWESEGERVRVRVREWGWEWEWGWGWGWERQRDFLLNEWCDTFNAVHDPHYSHFQTRYVDGKPTSEITPVTIQYIHPPHHGYPQVMVMVMNDGLMSLSFHVNQSPPPPPQIRLFQT